MTSPDHEFQVEIAEALLSIRNPEKFRNEITSFAPLLKTVFRTDHKQFLFYFYENASQSMKAVRDPLAQDIQFRAAYAYWHLTPHLPDDTPEEESFKQNSLLAAKELMLDIKAKSNRLPRPNPYLADLARDVLQKPRL